MSIVLLNMLSVNIKTKTKHTQPGNNSHAIVVLRRLHSCTCFGNPAVNLAQCGVMPPVSASPTTAIICPSEASDSSFILQTVAKQKKKVMLYFKLLKNSLPLGAPNVSKAKQPSSVLRTAVNAIHRREVTVFHEQGNCDTRSHLLLSYPK